MKVYKGFLLQEIMIAIVILTLILSFSLNNKSLLSKYSKEEAPVVFMGSAINALRDSNEDLEFKKLSVNKNKIVYKNKNNFTKTNILEKGMSVSANNPNYLLVSIGPFFKTHIESFTDEKRSINFKMNGKTESDRKSVV